MAESERQQWKRIRSKEEKTGNEKTKAITGKEKKHWCLLKVPKRVHTHTHHKDGNAAYVLSSASWRHLVAKLHRSNQVTCSLKHCRETHMRLCAK